MPDNYRIVTGRDHPDLRALSRTVVPPAWPEFMMHDPVAQGFVECYQQLGEFQFVLMENGTDDVLALGNSLPLRWDGAIDDLPDEGWDWAMVKGLDDLHADRRPNLLCALQIVVPSKHAGRRLSADAVNAMKEIAKLHGLDGLIAPVRPNHKARYPLTPMESYVRWTLDDGWPFDPWMRVHARLGARTVKVCHRAMLITGTVSEWESWTKMRFPDSGEYVVEGALRPVEIDRGRDLGTYIEPNVWMHHPTE